VGVEASALDQAMVDRLRADVYRRMAADTAENLFLKVHDAWVRDDCGRPMFPADVTSAVVYIVRNPLDIAVSSTYHWDMGMEKVVERMCNPALRVDTSEFRLAEQLRQFIGSWSGHVRSWLDESGLRAHVVRYEDLSQDPERALAGIVSACGLSCDRARVRRAVAFSDFRELQRQERAHGFRERQLLSRGGFFRRGQVGGWREELAPSLAARLVQSHRATMARFGYLGGSD
jgi:hypothetical protein